MEHLLYLTHRIPFPPNKGDKIRSFHLLRHLNEQYHVHLGTFIDDPDDWQYIDNVTPLCAETYFAKLNPRLARLRSIKGIFANRALTVDYYDDTGLKSWVDKTIQQHKIQKILIFSSAMAQYVMHHHEATRIVDFVDVDSDKWQQYSAKKRWPLSTIYARESKYLLNYERLVANTVDASLFVSQSEAELFKKLVPSAEKKIGHLSNGVDTEYFAPSTATENPYPVDTKAITFTGAMDYWPNVDAVEWFAKNVLPIIRQRHTEAQFYIVGSRPTSQVQALTALPGVHVTGTVPDVRPYLAHAQVVVAPLRIARGIQNKVLEAMAMAKSIVVSPQALEGINADPGREILIATHAEEFAQVVAGLLEKNNLVIGERAREKVLALYGWASNLERIDALMNPPPINTIIQRPTIAENT